MDSRIGQLVRNGKTVYYALVDSSFVEGTLDEVEIALGIRQPKPTRVLRSYTVHIEKKYPAWNEVGGFDIDVSAYDANNAVKTARKQMADQCFFGSMDGPVSYRARLNKD